MASLTATDSGSSERLLSLLASLGGLAVLPLAVYDIFFDGVSESPWLLVVSSPLIIVSVVLAVGWRSQSRKTKRTLQYVFLLTFVPIVAISVLVEPSHSGSAFPWPWYFQPAAVAFAALRWPLCASVGYLLLSTVTPVAVTMMVGATPTDGLIGSTVRRIGLVVIIALVYAVKSQMREYADELVRNERMQVRLEEQRLRREADEVYRSTIHDHVLGTLLSIVHSQGRATTGAQAEAQATLALGNPFAGRAGSIDVDVWVDELAARIRESNEGCSVGTDSSPDGQIPRATATVLADAAVEAVRNALRHNSVGIDVRAQIDASGESVTIVVVDDGQGFDVNAMTERLGVRESILGNVNGLAGGQASITSKIGAGTRVLLDWRRP